MYCAAAGNALSKLNRHADAISLYRQAIRLQPEFLEAHFALGAELADGKGFDEASLASLPKLSCRSRQSPRAF